MPVIFLSSMSDNMNIVMAINMGGDDFITKPYDLNVVVAKVQALLRRTYDFTDNTSTIEHNGGVLNLNDQTFMYNNNKVELTKNEYRILQCLLENVGKVVSRDSIMENSGRMKHLLMIIHLLSMLPDLEESLRMQGSAIILEQKRSGIYYFMKNVVLYLKSRIKVIVMLVVIAIVQFVVFYLYSVPVAPVIYSLELLSFMLAVAVVFDYMAFYRRHKALKHSLLCDEIFQVELYDTSDAIEDDYQQLLTKVLTQKYQANELREKSMADLRDYYAIWAHQIKTPISAIDVLLQAENEPDKIDLKELKRQLFNIDFYVDAVMNYLRLEDMSSDYVFEDCQVEKIVRKAVKKFAAQFIGKKISIELNNLDTNVKTDEKWLGFIIEQLISNAVKYTRNGGKISIYMKETFNSADRILVIEDNGIGITKEDIPRIFERGYTGYNGRMSKNHRESVCTFAGKQQISWGFLLQ